MGRRERGRKSRWVSQFSHLKKEIKKKKTRRAQKKKKKAQYLLFQGQLHPTHTHAHSHAHAHTHTHTRAPPKRGINPRNQCSRPAGEGRKGEGSGPVRETEPRTLRPQAAAGAAARVRTAGAALPPVAARLPLPHRAGSLAHAARRRPPHPGSPKLSPLRVLLGDWWLPPPPRDGCTAAAAKAGTGTAAGAVATVALADAEAPAAPAAAAAAASPPPPSASNSEPVETGSDWEIPSRLSFQPMAPRSVWNLGLRPQAARPLVGPGHSRATSLPLIGPGARQSGPKAPHAPAASAPASFQQ